MKDNFSHKRRYVGVVGVAGLLAFGSVQVELAVIDYVG